MIDPFGAAVSLWQPGAFSGWTHPLGLRVPGRIIHESPDPVAAEHFYRVHLGLPLRYAEFVKPLPGDPSDGDALWTVAIPLDGAAMRPVRPTTGHRYLRC